MPRKKNKIKKNKNGLAKIANLTTISLSNVILNYKKNKELKKIKDIKLQKLSDKNQILKEKKDLKIWEEKISKESRKIKLYEDEIKNREKDLKLQEDRLKIEYERLIRKDEDLIQIRKELYSWGNIRIKKQTIDWHKKRNYFTGDATKGRWQELLRQATSAQLSDVEVQILDKNKTKELYPVIEDRDLEGSVFMPEDGQADPVGVTNVLARAAKNEGVKIFEKTPVKKSLVNNDGLTSDVALRS